MIGAGAAGMMCAAQAGQRGRRVLLVEHYHKLGEKIRISGGGRCNFTNVGASPANYLSQNPDFCRSALARYTARDFVALVERHGIAYHEKKLGQLFCDRAAQDIIAMLKAECDRGRVEWRMPCAVAGIERADGAFIVATGEGPVRATSLVIATGGLTVPKIGATPFGYQVAEQFGLSVVPPRPALVPLALAPEWLARYGDLAGVALDVEVSLQRRALSRESAVHAPRPVGPGDPADLVVLGRQGAARDRSAAGRGRRGVVPGSARVGRSRRQRAGATAAAAIRRSVVRGARRSGADGPARRSPLRGDRVGAARWRVQPGGTLGYNKAEVTAGGVDTRGLSSKTMGATKVPGLFFIGEVVDVTGWLGGYNFQWAWSSGHAAGEHV